MHACKILASHSDIDLWTVNVTPGWVNSDLASAARKAIMDINCNAFLCDIAIWYGSICMWNIKQICTQMSLKKLRKIAVTLGGKSRGNSKISKIIKVVNWRASRLKIYSFITQNVRCHVVCIVELSLCSRALRSKIREGFSTCCFNFSRQFHRKRVKNSFLSVSERDDSSNINLIY